MTKKKSNNFSIKDFKEQNSLKKKRKNKKRKN